MKPRQSVPGDSTLPRPVSHVDFTPLQIATHVHEIEAIYLTFLGDWSSVPRVVDRHELDVAHLEPFAREVYDHIDGARTVGEIVACGETAAVLVLRALADFVQAGCVVVRRTARA